MEAQPVSEKRALLKSVFGYEGFRPGQEQLIDALLQGRDAMGIMPTGAGKSMCYQLPALLLPGITLVVSPLISLMKDQVNALVQSGVRAAYLNSSLTEGQTAKAIANTRARASDSGSRTTACRASGAWTRAGSRRSSASGASCSASS